MSVGGQIRGMTTVFRIKALSRLHCYPLPVCGFGECDRPAITGVKGYEAAEFNDKVAWMMKRGFLDRAPAYEETVRNE